MNLVYGLTCHEFPKISVVEHPGDRGDSGSKIICLSHARRCEFDIRGPPILNETPKGDQSGRGPSLFLLLNETILNTKQWTDILL